MSVVAIRNRARPHKPLLIALGLAAGSAAALGLARFAYALLLPSMRSALGWSFATASVMNTANAAGYLVGALTAALVAGGWALRAAFPLVLTARTAAELQRQLDEFREHYNERRFPRALARRRPGEIYRATPKKPSPRPTGTERCPGRLHRARY